jgi:hypothetical protein
MGIGTVAAIWSSVNPSYFTIKKFGITEEDKKLILQGFGIAIFLILIMLIGIWMVFK